MERWYYLIVELIIWRHETMLFTFSHKKKCFLTWNCLHTMCVFSMRNKILVRSMRKRVWTHIWLVNLRIELICQIVDTHDVLIYTRTSYRWKYIYDKVNLFDFVKIKYFNVNGEIFKNIWSSWYSTYIFLILIYVKNNGWVDVLIIYLGGVKWIFLYWN